MKRPTLILGLLLSVLSCYSQAPYLFTDFPVNPTGVIHNSDPKNFCIYNGKLFYSCFGDFYGDELWSTDGTKAGTVMVKDINTNAPGTYGFGSSPAGFTELNGKLIFAASTDINGRELWTTDGTTAGTVMLKEIYPGTGPSNPNDFIKLGNKLIFTAQTQANGIELWITDGTTSGTQLLKDIYPGTSTSYPAFLTYLNGKIYFSANNGTNGSELWVTDGTATGTQMLLDISTISNGSSSNPASLTEMGGNIYFYATDNTHGSELWVTDGSVAGTHIVKDIYPSGNGMETNSVNPLPVKFAVYNNKLYFSGKDSLHGCEVWCSDGTTAGTYMIKDINIGGNSYSLYQYIVYKGKLYFSATNNNLNSELWVTDGTTSGTQMVVDFAPGSPGSVPGYFTIFGNYMYYRGRQSITDNYDFQLVQTDGTAAGTKILAPPSAKWARPLERTREFIVYDSTLYFAASYDNHDNELWSLKDTTGSNISSPNGNNNNSANFELKVFPNPNPGIFTIDCNSNDFIGSKVHIYDMQGNRLLETIIDKPKMTFDISHFAQGVYMVKMRLLNNKTYTARVATFE